MTILVGTQDGVFRSESRTFDDLERVLDSGVTLGVHAFQGHGVFAASKTGLYRSTDRGTTWSQLDVPRTEVFAVAVSPDGSRLYAGTHPAHLYVSTDDGETWSEARGFQELPSRGDWHTPRHRGAAHVRSLGVHPDAPGRLVAGVEVGGVHVSDDYGETWSERRDDLELLRSDGLQFDVHHVLVVSAEEYVASCGGGLYRTRDSGHTWRLLDVDPARPYFQEAFLHDGVLYAAAQTLPPSLPMDGRSSRGDVDGALFESTDGGDSFDRVRYPGEPWDFVYAWTVRDDSVLAGTTGGHVLIREKDGWDLVGRVPSWIRSLTCIGGDRAGV